MSFSIGLGRGGGFALSSNWGLVTDLGSVGGGGGGGDGDDDGVIKGYMIRYSRGSGMRWR